MESWQAEQESRCAGGDRGQEGLEALSILHFARV